MSALSYSVKLFRLLEQPSIGGSNVFSSRNIILTKDIVEAVYGAWRYPSSGFSVEVVIGADRLTGGDKDPQTLESKIGEKANNIKVELSRKDDGQFYRGINDFVARAKTLNTGRLPEEFYIVDRDYHYPNDKDSKSDPYIAKLEGLCLFIDAIKHHICHFHDVTPTGKSRAILVISDDSNKSLSPKSIELKFTEELLELDSIPDLTLLNELRLPAALPHKEEKLSTLRVSIWEYLSYAKADDSTIYYLAFNWPDILDKYRASYELYIR
ncbi:hypothetical protein QE250_16835, partial [Chromatiaceae bacterium AAb-1]|nr:hypothetical protein [Chromatiaceae bacterium AAb-1]